MKKPLLLTALFFLALGALSAQTFPGSYSLNAPDAPTIGAQYPLSMILREDGTATITYMIQGEKGYKKTQSVHTWKVQKNLLFLDESSGYYIKWTKNSFGKWVLILTPAFDSAQVIEATKVK